MIKNDKMEMVENVSSKTLFLNLKLASSMDFIQA